MPFAAAVALVAALAVLASIPRCGPPCPEISPDRLPAVPTTRARTGSLTVVLGARIGPQELVPSVDGEGVVGHASRREPGPARRTGDGGCGCYGEGDQLPDTMRATAPADVLTEARGKSASALARLSYLAEWSRRQDIVETLIPLLPERLPVTFLGPRGHRRRWVKRWRLYDALLPAR